MKKKILVIFIIFAAFVFLLKSNINAKADTIYCDDDPHTLNWGYYYPESGNYLCLNGPAKTCDGIHIE